MAIENDKSVTVVIRGKPSEVPVDRKLLANRLQYRASWARKINERMGKPQDELLGFSIESLAANTAVVEAWIDLRQKEWEKPSSGK